MWTLDDFRALAGWGRCYALPWENQQALKLAKEFGLDPS